jgi:hypothetical protein
MLTDTEDFSPEIIDTVHSPSVIYFQGIGENNFHTCYDPMIDNLKSEIAHLNKKLEILNPSEESDDMDSETLPPLDLIPLNSNTIKFKNYQRKKQICSFDTEIQNSLLNYNAKLSSYIRSRDEGNNSPSLLILYYDIIVNLFLYEKNNNLTLLI